MENIFLAARGKIQFKMFSAQHSEVLKHYECTLQYSQECTHVIQLEM